MNQGMQVQIKLSITQGGVTWDYLALMFLCIWDEGVVSAPRGQDKGVLQRESVS